MVNAQQQSYLFEIRQPLHPIGFACLSKSDRTKFTLVSLMHRSANDLDSFPRGIDSQLL